MEGVNNKLREYLGKYVELHGLRASARKLDIPLSKLRSVLDSRDPYLSTAQEIAIALGFSLELAHEDKTAYDSTSLSGIDELQLKSVIVAVEEALSEHGRVLNPVTKAEAIIALYEFFKNSQTLPSKSQVLRIVKMAA